MGRFKEKITTDWWGETNYIGLCCYKETHIIKSGGFLCGLAIAHY
jgi:hypothetical protein